MEQKQKNRQKYENYREQVGRLRKAMSSRFYLEAISIEYAIIEDRIESVLRHTGLIREDKQYSITNKLNKLLNLSRESALAGKYFSEDLISSIHTWKNERNPMTHALLNLHLHTEDLQKIAEEGAEIVKTMCSKASSYNRTLERRKEKR